MLLSTEIVFPIVYRLFNVIFLAFIFSKWLKPENRLNMLCLVPLIGCVLDYCENSLVLTMLFDYPEKLYGIASAASMITKMKWFSNYTDWTLMIVALFGLLFTYILGKRKYSK